VEASTYGFDLSEMSDSGSVHSEVTDFEPDAINDEEEEVNEWVRLRLHPNYDIQNQYPFQIRKRSNQRIIALGRSNTGYLSVYINGHGAQHHRIIAEQFLANPDHLPQIDHINHVKDDNHLDNLRWVSGSDNQRNRTSYNHREVEYLDELPDGAEPIHEYRGRPIANGYYNLGREYFVEIAGKYRRITNRRNNVRGLKVSLRGPNGEEIQITWTP
jgi:hypothetical protein